MGFFDHPMQGLVSYVHDAFAYMDSTTDGGFHVKRHMESEYSLKSESINAIEYTGGNIEEIADFVAILMPSPYTGKVTVVDEVGCQSMLTIEAVADEEHVYPLADISPGDVLIHVAGRDFCTMDPKSFYTLFRKLG